METYYSLESLALNLCLPRAYLRRLEREGRLPRLEVSPGRYRYDPEAVRRVLSEVAAERSKRGARG